jgi:hypothetical protein
MNGAFEEDETDEDGVLRVRLVERERAKMHMITARTW